MLTYGKSGHTIVDTVAQPAWEMRSSTHNQNFTKSAGQQQTTAGEVAADVTGISGQGLIEENRSAKDTSHL